MLKPTINKEGGTVRERYLAKLAGASFFELWSYPNVYTDEGISKSKKGEELCDLLVVFGDDVIIFSDKDIRFNGEVDLDVAWKRWFKKAVVKSCKQLYGAESWVRRYPERLYLDEKCNTPIPFELTKEINIHLVAVTCNTVSYAEKYFGGSGSSSFIQVFSMGEKECFNRPFHVGWLYPNKKYIHILDEQSLDLLLGQLDTAYDFISYLKSKESAVESKMLALAAGEEEILAHYFRERHSLRNLVGSIGSMPMPGNGSLLLHEGLWREYIDETGCELEDFLKENSAFWDSLIKRFSTHILAGRVGVGQDLPFCSHERAVRFLASECRASRSILSTAFWEKFQEVPEGRRSARLVKSPQDGSILYVFLFLPISDGQKYKDYRDERMGYNHAYALVAKYLYENVTNVIVISTDTKGGENRSEDILATAFDGPLKGEELEHAKKLHEDENILNNGMTYRDRTMGGVLGNKPYRNKDKVYGRNEKCPCGSGKKYKKCCMP